MKIYTVGASVFATNTYLVVDDDTNKAVLIDPDGDGKTTASDARYVLRSAIGLEEADMARGKLRLSLLL